MWVKGTHEKFLTWKISEITVVLFKHDDRVFVYFLKARSCDFHIKFSDAVILVIIFIVAIALHIGLAWEDFFMPVRLLLHVLQVATCVCDKQQLEISRNANFNE